MTREIKYAGLFDLSQSTVNDSSNIATACDAIDSQRRVAISVVEVTKNGGFESSLTISQLPKIVGVRSLGGYGIVEFFSNNEKKGTDRARIRVI